MFLIKKLFVCLSIISVQVANSQCPTATNQFRNNGTGGTCLTVSIPSGKQHTGRFTFNSGTGFANDQYIDSIQLNGQLYQAGQTLYNNLGTIWFGGYKASSNDLCFYGNSSSDNAVPAGQWKIFFNDAVNNTKTSCSYTVTSGGSSSSFTPGVISGDQTICSGSTPSTISSSSAASPCTGGGASLTYQWQSSTTSSSSGFSNISGATDLTYSPGSLNATTYYVRIATCTTNSDVVSSSSNVITITVPTITSPTIGQTWSGSTITFQSNVSGGSWSISTSPATGVATINSSGVLTASGAGSGTVTYTTSSPTCTISRNFNIYGTSGSLPVTWETVSAEKQNGQSVLRWSTASEQNTKDFVVQHSLNTTDWSLLSTIPAAGNSTTQREYSFVHASPLKNNKYNYYRILQRDLDDKFSYSKIVSIIFNEPGADLQVYPNPARGVATVFVSEEQEVTLLNAAGAIIWRSKLPAGRSQLPLDRFSAGVYFLRTKAQTIKFLIN